ncbi:MAG: hypothetical protein RSA65_08470, partial [Clostridia bacterium]
MNDATIVGALSLLGTLVGTLGGIVTASKLTNYRIEQLEKKVDKHNTVVERMYVAEKRLEVVGEQIRAVDHRLEDLEDAEN